MSIQFKIKDRPNHPIIRAIKEFTPNQYNDSDLLIYYPATSETCGWTIEGEFLGYTIKEVVEKLKTNRSQL